MSTQAYEMQCDALVDAYITGSLEIKKLKAPFGSSMEYYWTFSDDKGLIDIAMSSGEAADTIMFIKNEAYLMGFDIDE